MSGAATAIAIGAGVGGLGSIASGVIGSNAAGNAASTQANAADQAAQLQYQASQNALDFQKQQFSTTQQELQPWLQSGTGALSNLNYLLGVTPQSATSGATPNGQTYAFDGSSTDPSTGSIRPTAGYQSGGAIPQGNTASLTTPTGTPTSAPGGTTPVPAGGSPGGGYGSLVSAYPGGQFTAPTASDLQNNDPGYQARLNLGTQALQQSAAAKGNLLTGGTAQSLNQLAQDYASNEYNNYYNQAYNTYSSNYNQWSNQNANTYNRLASLAGAGQTTANNLGTLGNSTANSVSNNLLSTANSMGNSYQNAAAANASGIIGGSNAATGAISGGTSSINQLLLMQQLYGGGGQTSGGSTYQPNNYGYDS